MRKFRVPEYRAEDVNPKLLTEQLAAKKKRMKEILDGAKAETRAMSEDEDKEFTNLEKEANAIKATLAAEERARELFKEDNSNSDDKKEDKKASEERANAEETAFERYIRGGSVQEIRASGFEMTQGKNGDIVPTRISSRIITEIKDMCPFLELSDVVETNGEFNIPVYGENETNYINADYVDEGTDLTDNVGTFTSINLTGYVIGALSLISNKLINNTDVDIISFVVKQMAESFYAKLEGEFISGTKKIKGILNTDKGITAASAVAITYDELVSLKHSLKRRFRNKAKWLMNPTTYTSICKLKDANGLPYFKEEDYKILGLEVIESDNMPEIGAGVKPIVIADFSGYTIKCTKNFQVQPLREKFATKNMLNSYCAQNQADL
ncbi:MAG: phage major capsid protein [Oscillospiraceae bacterium]|nr:phage major capsid protein [Oscillospiraceae bacterium]